MKILYKMIGYAFVITLLLALLMVAIANLAMDDLREDTTEDSSRVLIEQEMRKLHNQAMDRADLNEMFLEDIIGITLMMSDTLSDIIYNESYSTSSTGIVSIKGYNYIHGGLEGSVTGGVSGHVDCDIKGDIGSIDDTLVGMESTLACINTTFLSGEIDAVMTGDMLLPEDVSFTGNYEGDPVEWSNAKMTIDGRIEGILSGDGSMKDSGCGFSGYMDGHMKGKLTGGLSSDMKGDVNIQLLGWIDGILNGSCNSSPETIRSFLMAVDNNDPLVDSAYVGLETPWHSLNEAGSIFSAPSYGYLGYNATKRDWYINAVEGGDTFIVKPYMDATGLGRMITISSPIYIDGRMAGAAAVDVTIKNVIEKMITISSYDTAASLLIDEEGLLIASDEMDSRDTLWFDEVEYEDLKEIEDENFNDIIAKVLDGESGVYRLELDLENGGYSSDLIDIFCGNPGEGCVRYFAFAPINSTGWGFVITVDENEILEPAREMSEDIDSSSRMISNRFLLISFIILVLSLGVGGFIGFGLMRPLEDLTDNMDRMTDPSKHISSVHSERYDEVGKLARSFDDMNRRLARSMGTLEYEIEERKRKEEELEKERKRAEFYLDLLGHDIGNLHQGIYGALQIAEMKKDDPEMRERALNMAGENVHRSMTFIRNINLLNKLSSQKEELERTDIGPMMTMSVKNTRAMFPTKEIDIEMQLPDEKVEIMAEPVLDTVFINLLHNGIKFQTGPRAELGISIEKDHGNGIARIRITDRGRGIDDEMKKRIFERFKSTEYETKSGTGLGLHIVKILVKRYGGMLKVEDRVAGDHSKGSSFTLEFPMV